MPVLVIADLHLDFWLQAGRDPFASLDPKLLASLDALIIAGDMSNKPKVRWPIALIRMNILLTHRLAAPASLTCLSAIRARYLPRVCPKSCSGVWLRRRH